MATKQSENGQKKKAPAFSAKIDALCDTGSSTKRLPVSAFPGALLSVTLR